MPPWTRVLLGLGAVAAGTTVGALACDTPLPVWVLVFSLIGAGSIAIAEAASGILGLPVLARLVFATLLAVAVATTAGWATVILNFGHCPFTLFQATSIAA
ncbi:MAG: hypothetical protein ICV67_00280 [Thermoleophilia bacterium]|nr:hypothetical protein [Thermoleophilia bacterium]